MNSEGVTRRRVIGSAWAVPVLVAAVAAPAVAASGGTPHGFATLVATRRPMGGLEIRYDFTVAFFDAADDPVSVTYVVSGFQPALDRWVEIVTTDTRDPQTVTTRADITVLRAVAVYGEETVHVEAPVIRMPSAQLVVRRSSSDVIAVPTFRNADGTVVAPDATLSGLFADNRWQVLATGRIGSVAMQADYAPRLFRVVAVVDGTTVSAETPTPSAPA
ncbi:MAG: hypothetical protein Q7T71_11090 [Herbiconiux sp.]|nr:hypothetical protein [Herbiconiux sp.]